jgi:hypothetical protein
LIFNKLEVQQAVYFHFANHAFFPQEYSKFELIGILKTGIIYTAFLTNNKLANLYDEPIYEN